MEFKKISNNKNYIQKKLIVVTGLGRSRTSLTMKYFSNLGYKPFYDKDISKPNSNNESGLFEHKLTNLEYNHKIIDNLSEILSCPIEKYLSDIDNLKNKVLEIKDYKSLAQFIEKHQSVCFKSFCLPIIPILSFLADYIDLVFLYRTNFNDWRNSLIKNIVLEKWKDNDNFQDWYRKLTSNNLNDMLLIRKRNLAMMERTNIIMQKVCENNNTKYKFHFLTYEDFDDNIHLTNKRILEIAGGNKNIDCIKDLYKRKK
ncbi:MAG: hypothetical protein ACOCV1_02400 [Bacillota bacterium]